jgi:uncharacterized repeat protein (TIGR01451 family)
MTYSLVEHNGGPLAATGVIVSDAIPSGTTFVSCAPAAFCTGPAVGSNGTVTFNLGTLASGTTVPLSIVVNVTASAGSTLINTALTSSSVTDSNPANNSSTAVTTVASPPPTADLSLSKGGSPNPVVSGSNLTYTLTVNNGGPDSASAVALSDPLPPQTTLFSPPSPSQGTCTGPAVGTNGTVHCDLGPIASGGFATVTIVVRVNAPAGGTVTNTASVSSATSDPNSSNNSTSVTTTVNP